MASRREKVLALIALVLAAAAVVWTLEPPFPLGTKLVDITSDLSTYMYLHCRSPGDNRDLGPILLFPNNTYTFAIEPFSTASYACDFTFDGVNRTFEIYNEQRDLYGSWGCDLIGGHFICNWYIEYDGPCLNSSVQCHPWS